MMIIGNEDEINWVLGSLTNACENCPFIKPCEEIAKRDMKENGKVKKSCMEYLKENIKFEIVKHNI